MQRIPAFKPVPDTGEPLLPDIDIDVNTLRVDRFIFEPAVAGERQEARLNGKIAIADRRAQVTANAETIGAKAKGDTFALLLDAVPDANRLAMTLDVKAPQGGVLAAMGGFKQPLTAKLDGRGGWKAWDGNLVADLGAGPLARLALTARDGTFVVKGTAQASRFFSGATSALLGPQTAVDLTAKLAERKADLTGSVSSDVFRLGINGGVDLGTSRYDGLSLPSSCFKPWRDRARVSRQRRARDRPT